MSLKSSQSKGKSAHLDVQNKGNKPIEWCLFIKTKIMTQRKMKIELEPYDHTCADGCCYTTGYDVFVDGEKIGHTIGEDAMELAQLLNETFNTKEK